MENVNVTILELERLKQVIGSLPVKISVNDNQIADVTIDEEHRILIKSKKQGETRLNVTIINKTYSIPLFVVCKDKDGNIPSSILRKINKPMKFNRDIAEVFDDRQFIITTLKEEVSEGERIYRADNYLQLREKSLYNVSCNTENIFPGFYILSNILEDGNLFVKDENKEPCIMYFDLDAKILEIMLQSGIFAIKEQHGLTYVLKSRFNDVNIVLSIYRQNNMNDIRNTIDYLVNDRLFEIIYMNIDMGRQHKQIGGLNIGELKQMAIDNYIPIVLNTSRFKIDSPDIDSSFAIEEHLFRV